MLERLNVQTTRPVSRIPLWLGWSVVVSLCLLARPYNGLRHDGVLYLGQALMQLWPGTFSHDLFFAHGSQDAFSVVSKVLAWLYLRVGIDVVHLVVPLGAQLALLAAAAMFLAELPDLERWLGLVVLAVASHVYGGHGIFAFGERFLTGRTIAEPLALAALIALHRGHRPLAIVAWLGAAAFHPLVALAAGAVGWLLLVLEDRRWVWTSLLIGLPLLAGVAGVRPFDGFYRTIDPQWWRPVAEVSPHLLLSRWTYVDWQVVGLDLVVLTMAAATLPRPIALLAKASLFASIAALGLSLVMVDWLHNELISQLQIWRVLWIAHFLALGLSPAIALHLARQDTRGRLCAMAFGLAAIAVNIGWSTAWILMAWFGGTLVLVLSKASLSDRAARLATWSTLAITVALSLASATKLVRVSASDDGQPSAQTVIMAIATAPLFSIAVAAAIFVLASRGERRRVSAAMVTASVAFLMMLGVTHWDHRTQWSKYVEASLRDEHPFSRHIPAHAQVYWHEDVAASWALLKRANYFSISQGAGMIFNRGTAIDFAARQPAFAKLKLQESICAIVDGLNDVDRGDSSECVPTAEVIGEICKESPKLGFMIFKFPVAPAVLDRWTFGRGTPEETTYYLHDCAKLR